MRNNKTLFIRSLTVDAENLVSQSQTADIKMIATKVYESIRYSDPMSSSGIEDIECQIRNEFKAFSEAVKDNDYELASASAVVLLNLLQSRNNKCKLLK